MMTGKDAQVKKEVCEHLLAELIIHSIITYEAIEALDGYF
jgi:hypothetical protein